jgi:RNA polymerase sigma-70 factor (ECF subfamily)
MCRDRHRAARRMSAFRNPNLPSTQWSLLARLKDKDEATARIALDELCRAYHYPLYCQIRRRGLSHHDAEDALQEFFLKLLRRDTLSMADEEKGRLRSFLLVALRRFLATWHRDQLRQGSGWSALEAQLDLAAAGQRFERDAAAHHESPDRLYDRQWAQELMNRVLEKLRLDYAAKGRGGLFEALYPGLLDGGSLAGWDSEALAAKLGIRPTALRTGFHRLLAHFREALRREILQTVEDREMAKQEFAELIALVRRH